MQGSRHRIAAAALALATCGALLAPLPGVSATTTDPRYDGLARFGEVPWVPTHPFAAAPHNVRMSIASLETDAGRLFIEVRFFWDDLQIGIMERTSDMEFELAETPQVDEVVERYINDMLTLEVDGERLQGRVTSRGIQEAPRVDEVMWWYRLEYDVEGTPERLYVKNRLLFNMFEDQRNILHVTTRSGRERAYYFSWTEEDVTVPLR